MKGRCLPEGERMKYTEAIHAKNLLKLLSTKDPCGTCPVSGDISEVCPVCARFVNNTSRWCPCNQFGKKEAIKRTWLALEEKGYLD